MAECYSIFAQVLFDIRFDIRFEPEYFDPEYFDPEPSIFCFAFYLT